MISSWMNLLWSFILKIAQMTDLMGYTDYEGIHKWENALNRAQVSQWQTVASSITNEVNTAIGKANDILAKLQ